MNTETDVQIKNITDDISGKTIYEVIDFLQQVEATIPEGYNVVMTFDGNGGLEMKTWR